MSRLILQEDIDGYSYVHMTRIGTDEAARALFFSISGRTKIFFANDITTSPTPLESCFSRLGC